MNWRSLKVGVCCIAVVHLDIRNVNWNNLQLYRFLAVCSTSGQNEHAGGSLGTLLCKKSRLETELSLPPPPLPLSSTEGTTRLPTLRLPTGFLLSDLLFTYLCKVRKLRPLKSLKSLTVKRKREKIKVQQVRQLVKKITCAR